MTYVIFIGIKSLPASPQNPSRKKASVSLSKERHILYSPKYLFGRTLAVGGFVLVTGAGVGSAGYFKKADA